MFLVNRARSILRALSNIFFLISNWFLNQLRLRHLAQTFITLCLFGLVPHGWLIGLPLIGAYATARIYLYKKLNPAEFKNMLNNDFTTTAKKLANFKRNLTYKNFLRYCLDNPLSVGKFTFSFLVLFMWSMPFSFFTIYGLYRFTDAKWREVFIARANNAYHLMRTTFREVNRRFNVGEKAVMLFVGGSFLIAGVSVLGGAHIIAAGMSELTWFALESALEICTTAVGLTAIASDVGHLIDKPVQNLIENPGKFYGLVWGRWLAFAAFFGKVIGSMGPATGHVDQSGVLSSIFNFLFPPAGSWFSFGTGLTGVITTRFMAFVNSIVTSIFFSYNMRITGDFYGVIGPTSFQIFLCMAIGCLLGYITERLAFDICEAAAHDIDVVHHTRPVQNSIRYLNQIADWLFRQRWNIAFALSMAPVVLASPGGPAIYGLAYGHEILAMALAFSAGFISMALVDNLFNEVRRAYRAAFHPANTNTPPQNTPQAEPPVPHLDTPSPSMLHAASRARETRSAERHVSPAGTVPLHLSARRMTP